MSKTMDDGRKQTKRERQRAAAEARASALQRRAKRRTLAYVLGGVALIAAVVLAVFALSGGEPEEGTEGVGPSAAGTVTSDGPDRAEPLGVGDAIPGFTAPAIGGGDVDWADFAGSPAVISVWAPWCPHCQVELPILDGVMQGFPDVSFLTIVTSIGDSPGPDAGVFLADNGIDAPTAIDDGAGTLAAAFGIQGFPTLYFVDSGGAVVQELEGEVDAETLRELIGSLT
ncbi:MAG: TlpA family protein disulfide reductase [Actinomycetota bacterium]